MYVRKVDLPKIGPKHRPEFRTKLAVRGAGDQAVQDLPGDLAAGRREIRVVLVDEPEGWRAYFCTEASATVADTLGRVSDRFSLETAFRDCKEVVGAGQQQVRFVWANIGAFHICLWTCTMTEAWAWGRSEEELVDREQSPWNDPDRRPSHADKRRAWRRELLAEEIREALRPGITDQEIQDVAQRGTERTAQAPSWRRGVSAAFILFGGGRTGPLTERPEVKRDQLRVDQYVCDDGRPQRPAPRHQERARHADHGREQHRRQAVVEVE